MTSSIAALARDLGVIDSYTDQTKKRRRTRRDTSLVLLAALGHPVETEVDAADRLAEREARRAARSLPDWRVCEAGRSPDLHLPGAWYLDGEDGTKTEGRGALPKLPLGLHRLCHAGDSCTLIAAPRRLPLPEPVWGLTAPLYGLAAEGLGDYGDLAVAGAALAQLGGAFLGLNPIHAGFWDDPSCFSPYTPSHRRRLNTFHLADAHHGAAATGPLIDWPAEIAARRTALEAAFKGFEAQGGDPTFEMFLKEEGAALKCFATHQALSDRHGPYWTDWPVDLQDPDSAETARAEADLAPAIRFHSWLQWRATRALAAARGAMREAGAAMGLYLDLAVGTHPAGAETWEHPSAFARGVTLGAPPDAFAADGQRWGLAPLNPQALVAEGFRPLAETLRAQFRHAGAVRIDHILGFERAFWVPETAGVRGAYIRMPREAMLAVLRLEAARVGGVVVGEDLGNVPRGLRKVLRQSGILGCRVAMFEHTGDPPRFLDPAHYPAASLASFSTHDLPTWRGWRAGADIEAHCKLEHIDETAAATAHADRNTAVAAFDAATAQHRPDGVPPASSEALTRTLAASGSAMVALQAECVFGMEAQPNLPGTVAEYPNWRQRLPIAATEWQDSPELSAAAALMATTRRGGAQP